MDYWICTHRNSSLKGKIYIHYFRRQGLLDSTLINACRILKKTIQYMSYFEIVDIHAPLRKMIKNVKNNHDFKKRHLLDSNIDFR